MTLYDICECGAPKDVFLMSIMSHDGHDSTWLYTTTDGKVECEIV